jgi:hypothetical protein
VIAAKERWERERERETERETEMEWKEERLSNRAKKRACKTASQAASVAVAWGLFRDQAFDLRKLRGMTVGVRGAPSGLKFFFAVLSLHTTVSEGFSCTRLPTEKNFV